VNASNRQIGLEQGAAYAASSHPEERAGSQDRLMALSEGDQGLDLVACDGGVIVSDFFDRATEVVFIDNLLGWYAGALD
jgi:hypothetical protein